MAEVISARLLQLQRALQTIASTDRSINARGRLFALREQLIILLSISALWPVFPYVSLNIRTRVPVVLVTGRQAVPVVTSMRRETLARVHLSITVPQVTATIPPGVNAKGLLNVLRDQATVLQLTSAFKQPRLAVLRDILIPHLRKGARDLPTAPLAAVTV